MQTHAAHAQPSPPAQAPPRPAQPFDAGSGRNAMLGLLFFIVGMTMAFAWLIYAYLIVRQDYAGQPVFVPVWLWVSTFVILVSSVTLQSSQMLAKMNNSRHARRALAVSVVLGWLFAVLQAPGLWELVAAHRFGDDSSARLYRLIFIIVAIHGAHALGGLLYMSVTLWRTRHRTIDARQAPHLRNLCIYWHYLAILWLLLFCVFLFAPGVTAAYDMATDTLHNVVAASWIAMMML